MAVPVACVLAGGASRRFGTDKALVAFEGATLLVRAARRLASQADTVLINRNAPGLPATLHGHSVVPDTIPDGGPLAGVLAALDWMHAHHPEAPYLLTVPVDVPLFPDDLGARLAEALHDAPAAGLAYAACNGRAHPLCALWRASSAAALRATLEQGIHRVLTATEQLGAQPVDWHMTAGPDPFTNINTPDALAALTPGEV